METPYLGVTIFGSQNFPNMGHLLTICIYKYIDMLGD